jgi:hypothetical protein
MRFRDLAIGQEFDWRGPSIYHQSFTGRCWKISPRRYRCQGGFVHTVGTINATVYNVNQKV